MNQNNYNNGNVNANMDGRPSSSASGQSNGMNEHAFLQQMFPADVAAMQQQQQGQPFFYNAAFANQAAAQGGLMGFDPSQMMMMQNAAQMQQPQLYVTNPFMNVNVQQQQPSSAAQSQVQPQMQQQSGGQPAFMQYSTQPAVAAMNNGGLAQAAYNQSITDIGGVSVPPMAAGTPTILHVEAAANAAATAAAPSRKRKSTKKDTTTSRSTRKKSEELSASATALINNAMSEAGPQSNDVATNNSQTIANSNNANNNTDQPTTTMTPEQKAQSSRDRNREHARCTRLRKKAYVNKLKELVDGLHAERSEDTRKRRAAVQALASVQDIRRKVVHTFLGYHARYEGDAERWRSVLEEDFWMKQPVTPFRSFRRCEIDKVSCCFVVVCMAHVEYFVFCMLCVINDVTSDGTQ
jgi:hypothetical protein